MSTDGWSHEEMEAYLRQTEFLLHSMPDLEAIRRKARGWDDYGDKIATLMEKDQRGKPATEESLWRRAKHLVHTAMTGNDARNVSIRTRVCRSPTVSALVHADLSLWLAGELSISISVTKRLVAVMLVGLAESKGDWNALAY